MNRQNQTLSRNERELLAALYSIPGEKNKIKFVGMCEELARKVLASAGADMLAENENRNKIISQPKKNKKYSVDGNIYTINFKSC